MSETKPYSYDEALAVAYRVNAIHDLRENAREAHLVKAVDVLDAEIDRIYTGQEVSEAVTARGVPFDIDNEHITYAARAYADLVDNPELTHIRITSPDFLYAPRQDVLEDPLNASVVLKRGELKRLFKGGDRKPTNRRPNFVDLGPEVTVTETPTGLRDVQLVHFQSPTDIVIFAQRIRPVTRRHRRRERAVHHHS